MSKLGLMCLAQGHNAVAPVRLEPTDTHYHDSKSQSLNPENKLLYEMKKISSSFFFAITFLSSILAKCVNGKAVEKTFRQPFQKVW